MWWRETTNVGRGRLVTAAYTLFSADPYLDASHHLSHRFVSVQPPFGARLILYCSGLALWCAQDARYRRSFAGSHQEVRLGEWRAGHPTHTAIDARNARADGPGAPARTEEGRWHAVARQYTLGTGCTEDRIGRRRASCTEKAEALDEGAMRAHTHCVVCRCVSSTIRIRRWIDVFSSVPPTILCLIDFPLGSPLSYATRSPHHSPRNPA